MSSKLLFLFFLTSFTSSSHGEDYFTYNGFQGANLTLSGPALVSNNGLLRLTNDTYQQIGRAFHTNLLHFKNTSSNKAFSFSTTFVFAIFANDPTTAGGHGISFVISPLKEFPGALPSHYMGLFNLTTNGNKSNHVVAVELDTIRSVEFGDIDNNHVGIDINSLMSISAAPAAYFSEKNGGFTNLTLISGAPTQLWIDYDGVRGQMNVTLSPIDVPKPIHPLLSLAIDLSSTLEDYMYVGLISATGSLHTSHYILGWSFMMNGYAPPLNLSSLPSLPHRNGRNKAKPLVFVLVSVVAFIVALIIILVVFYAIRRIKFTEVVEDWELKYGPQRFLYKDLYVATKGFSNKEVLGVGGFGQVYRGVLPACKSHVAVKKFFHDSRQGMKEFVAEITSIGRIQHRNLVRLLGYCRRKRELFLVYDFMPNGSLDKFLFDQTKGNLNWAQRFHIVKGVASGLLYLHEEWEQVVLHRDIKASNVLLGHELNGALGDFGLARLYDHGTEPRTTHVVGTYGYIAPEMAQTGKATTGSDVFAFGVFLLEVACGQRPTSRPSTETDLILVDWVSECWKKGQILEAADPNLRNEFVVEEMELVLKLGLSCSHPTASSRPSMRQVVQFLNGTTTLPSLSVGGFCSSHADLGYDEGFDDLATAFSSVTESLSTESR